MAISMSEAYLSRDGVNGDQPDFQLIYYTFNEPNEIVAESYCIQNAAQSYYGLPFVQTDREQINETTYKFTCHYKWDIKAVAIDNMSLSFNTQGGTQHITNSLGYIQYASSLVGGTPIDYNGAIGVELNDTGDKARVRGVDIFSPLLDFNVTTQFFFIDVDQEYVLGLSGMVGTTNNAPWYGYPEGTVLFKGARGSQKGVTKWEIAFEFAFSPNLTNLTIGAMTGISKGGWQYLDILYVSNGRNSKGLRIMAPGQVTVHTVYNSSNFAALKLGTSFPQPYTNFNLF